MNILFDREQQEIFGPQGHHQNNYTYYSGSNREEIIQIRLQLEKWFEAYPDSDKDDLRNNFKNDFDAGFFELFLFTLFQKIGYCVKIHPKVPNSTKKPDFLVTGFGQEFYLEAKVSFYDSQEEKSAKKMLASLYSVLDQSDILDFFIYIRRIELKGNQQPRANIIRKAMEKTINSYDVNDLFEKMNNGKINQPFIHIYEDDNIYIEYGPIPKSNKGRGKKNHRAVGVYGMDAKILNNVESLRKALKVKSGRYGMLDKPYVIAINAVDMLALDKDDVMDCLMGSTCIVPELITNQNAFQEFREHDGFFTGRNDKGQNTRVSAAMITKIHPSNWRDSDYWIFENEMAILPINLRNSSLITRFIQDGIIYRTSGKSFGDIIVY